MHQIHLSPAQTGGLGKQDPHATATGIRDATGWIKPLAGGASTHQQPASLPIALPTPERQRLQRQQQGFRLGHPPSPFAITGQQSGAWPQGQDPLEVLEVLPIAADPR